MPIFCIFQQRGGSSLQEIGEFLRQAREEKGFSLNDISEATKIRTRYLEAIESGDFAVLPGEVYVKGFLMNYATAVGISSAEVLKRYNQIKEARRHEAELKSAQEPLPLAPQSGRRINIDEAKGIYLALAIFLFLLLIIGLALLPQFGAAPEARPDLPRPSVRELTEPIASSLLPAPITVEAIFSEAAWVEVISDGKLYISQEFSEYSARQMWTAQSKMKIITGNAGGMRLYFNGRSLGVVGGAGERKELVFTPSGLTAP
jgi:transcriptional regulator with XRE-family HTH domain